MSDKNHDFGSLVCIYGQAVRLFGCNAPERKTAAGQEALAYLQTIVKAGDRVELVSHGWDKFGGRLLGSVIVRGAPPVDLVAAMIAAGHAVKWDGRGPKPTPPRLAVMEYPVIDDEGFV